MSQEQTNPEDKRYHTVADLREFETKWVYILRTFVTHAVSDIALEINRTKTVSAQNISDIEEVLSSALPMASADDFSRMLDNVGKTFVRLAKSDPTIQKDPEEILSDLKNIDDITRKAATVNYAALPKWRSLVTRAFKNGWDKPDRSGNRSQLFSIFKVLHYCGMTGRFKEIMDMPGNLFPPHFKNVFAKWEKTHGATLPVLPAAEDMPVVSLPALPETETPITIIEVDEVATPGTPDPLLAAEHDEIKSPDLDLMEQRRLEFALDMLRKHGIRNDRITVYKEMVVEDVIPHALVDVKSELLRVQILISDHHLTYVIHNPHEFSSESPLVISDLRDRDSVWQFKMMTEEQWLRDLQKYLFTPTENLEIQVKHRVAWPDKAVALRESFIAAIIHTGCIPKTNDNTQIAHGPMAQQKGATWAKANTALLRGAIPVYDRAGISSRFDLFNYLAAQMPELRSFLHAEPVAAEPVIGDIRRITTAENCPITKDLYEIMDSEQTRIAGRRPAEIDMALRYGAVQGLGAHVPANIPAPRDIQELQLALGIARLEEDELVLTR